MGSARRNGGAIEIAVNGLFVPREFVDEGAFADCPSDGAGISVSMLTTTGPYQIGVPRRNGSAVKIRLDDPDDEICVVEQIL